MRTINEIATWFKNNNILAKKDNLRVKILSLYTKVAYTISSKELKCSELNFENGDINIGITDTEVYADFPADELQILKTINHVYGYEELKYLILDLTHIQNVNIENVTNYLKERITSDLEGFQYYDFEEYVLLLGNNVFFVNNNVKLTDEEKQSLRTYNKEEQDSFIVLRDEQTGKLVVY